MIVDKPNGSATYEIRNTDFADSNMIFFSFSFLNFSFYTKNAHVLWFLAKRTQVLADKTGKTYAFFLKIRFEVSLSGQNGIFSKNLKEL